MKKRSIKVSQKKGGILMTKTKTTKRKAFTLAEVLITMTVIGVVAAMTIPTLLSNINGKQRATKIQNIELKLRQGTDLMKVQGQINGFNNTREFVDELSKYMKISTICDKANIAKCWPGGSITVNGEDDAVDVTSIQDAGWFQLDTDKFTDPVGFITGDGTPMIISYNKDCFIDENIRTSDGTACIAGIFDLNGAQGPNRYGDTDTNNPTSDIIPINTIGGIGNKIACALELDGTCFTSIAFIPDDTPGGCEKLQASGVDTKGCPSDVGYGDIDYWANAYLKCKDSGGRLPNEQELQKLAMSLYNTNTYKPSGITLDYAKANALGINVTSGSAFWVWAIQPYSSTYSYGQVFHPSSTGYYGYGCGIRFHSGYWGVCVGE